MSTLTQTRASALVEVAARATATAERFASIGKSTQAASEVVESVRRANELVDRLSARHLIGLSSHKAVGAGLSRPAHKAIGVELSRMMAEFDSRHRPIDFTDLATLADEATPPRLHAHAAIPAVTEPEPEPAITSSGQEELAEILRELVAHQIAANSSAASESRKMLNLTVALGSISFFVAVLGLAMQGWPGLIAGGLGLVVGGGALGVWWMGAQPRDRDT